MEELKKVLSKEYLRGAAESHLSAWFGKKYKSQNKEEVLFQLGQHDDSLEIENVKEILKRELSPEETDYLIEQFHNTVIECILFHGASGWYDTCGDLN